MRKIEMINRNAFWKKVERNKHNPVNFQEEIQNMSLEDMFNFYVLIEEMEKPFFEDIKVDNFLKSLQENDIYTNIWIDDIIFRGKEFYEAFINCDEVKIIKMLDKNPAWVIGVMKPEKIWSIYGMKVATKDELERLSCEERQTMWTCLGRFWNKIDELGLRENL